MRIGRGYQPGSGKPVWYVYTFCVMSLNCSDNFYSWEGGTDVFLFSAGVIHFPWIVPGNLSVYMLDKVEAVQISMF